MILTYAAGLATMPEDVFCVISAGLITAGSTLTTIDCTPVFSLICSSRPFRRVP
jgi:hypothetical protein